jgi:hypothetical protein
MAHKYVSPMDFAMHAGHGAQFVYEEHGMVPVMENELDRLCEVAADRGLELWADDNGLGLVRS